MIPKIIHYCWFGRGEKPKLAKKCIASWKKYMPDYEIIEWNEDNFDVNYNAYTKMCYEQKKYAFLTDYIRLLVVEERGGIYFDTDVEVLESFNPLTQHEAFFGFENDSTVATGLGFGSVSHHPILQQMIEEYDGLLDGEHGVIGCPILNTQALQKFGLQKNGKEQTLPGDAVIYPTDFFNPRNSLTGELAISGNTYSIHWYSASWLPWYLQLRAAIGKPVRRFLYKILGK